MAWSASRSQQRVCGVCFVQADIDEGNSDHVTSRPRLTLDLTLRQEQKISEDNQDIYFLKSILHLF